MLKGITVKLYEKTEAGVDDFGNPTYTETPVDVANVLVAPTLSDDQPEQLTLTGKKATYTLGIPKGDAHVWENRRIDFFGKSFHSFGFVVEGVEALVPTKWHKKVYVEIYG